MNLLSTDDWPLFFFQIGTVSVHSTQNKRHESGKSCEINKG